MAVTLGQIEYHVFADVATFTAAGLDPIGTLTELRGSTWYQGKLLQAPELGMSFADGTGLQRATDVQLVIADGPDGAYRASAVTNNLRGSSAVVTLVLRERLPDGTVVEVTEQQQLTVTALSVSPQTVTLRCQDIETTKLDALYPTGTWNATDWPEIVDNDAGTPRCFPVGTALKFPCPLLASDDANAQYFFGACEGKSKLLAIVNISAHTQVITLSSDLTDLIEPGQAVYVVGSTGSDGRYTVDAVLSTTSFSVVEAIASSATGSVRIMPHVRTVYRSGRVVDPSEYSVIHVVGHALTNGDFETGSFTGWTVSTVGTGTASAASHKAVLTSPSPANTATISQSLATSKDQWHAVSLDVDAASSANVTVSGTAVDAPRTLVRGGRRAAFFRATSTGTNNISFTPAAGSGSVTLDNIALFPAGLVVILFDRPQVDFQGNAYRIEADVRGVEPRNAATEVSRLLVEAGLTPNTASFAAAAGVATAASMIVDCGYGRGGQRTLRAILDDHLYLLRGALSRDGSGQYTLWQDALGAKAATYDEALADSIEVTGVDWGDLPSSVSLRYRPGARDPTQLQNTIKRNVSGGQGGDASPRDLPYVRDHVAADQLLCYLALRAHYNGRCQATVYREQHHLSDIISINSPLNWGTPEREWIVRGVQRTPRANKLDLLEYATAIYTYTASPTLPTDASSTGYEPDYSETPPLAPSGMAITATGVALATDGTSSAWAAVKCLPPAVNWAQVWFTAIHNVTGEIVLAQATDIGGGYQGVTLGGLRAGNVYQLKAYAVNSFNVQGALLATFNATAIGGGATDITFPTPGYATLPPNVASISAAQGTGLIVQVSWPAVSLSADVLAEYILERRTYAGSYSEVWRGRANSYTDRDLSVYGMTLNYRVKARDRWGNVSAAYATSSTVTLVRNIYGGTGSSANIADGTVESVNRTNVSAISTAFSTPNPQKSYSISHGLGKVPLVTYDVTSRSQYWVSLSNITSTTLGATISQFPNYQDGTPNPGKTGVNDTAGDPHRHPLNVLYSTDASTFIVRIW